MRRSSSCSIAWRTTSPTALEADADAVGASVAAVLIADMTRYRQLAEAATPALDART